jgi:hypothetical protein
MMNKSESAKCFNEQIRKRWPRWTPRDVEISDWLVWLAAFDPPAIATAARKHLAESRYAKPIPAQLLDHAKKLKAANRPCRPSSAEGKPSSGVPDAHTYITCTAKDERGCGCVGWFVPILIWPFHKTYTPQTYRRAAEEQCHLHANRGGGGGIWEIFSGTTHSGNGRPSHETPRHQTPRPDSTAKAVQNASQLISLEKERGVFFRKIFAQPYKTIASNDGSEVLSDTGLFAAL